MSIFIRALLLSVLLPNVIYADQGNQYLGNFDYKDWSIEGYIDGKTKQKSCFASSYDVHGTSSININWNSHSDNQQPVSIDFVDHEERHEALIVGGTELTLKFDDGSSVKAIGQEKTIQGVWIIEIFPQQDILPLMAKNNKVQLFEPYSGLVTTFSLSGFTATYRKMVELCDAPLQRITTTTAIRDINQGDINAVIAESYGSLGTGTDPVIQYGDFNCDNAKDALVTVYYKDNPDGVSVDTTLITINNGAVYYDSYFFTENDNTQYALCSLDEVSTSFVKTADMNAVRKATGIQELCHNAIKVDDGECNSVYIYWSNSPRRNSNIVFYRSK